MIQGITCVKFPELSNSLVATTITRAHGLDPSLAFGVHHFILYHLIIWSAVPIATGYQYSLLFLPPTSWQIPFQFSTLSPVTLEAPFSNVFYNLPFFFLSTDYHPKLHGGPRICLIAYSFLISIIMAWDLPRKKAEESGRKNCRFASREYTGKVGESWGLRYNFRG